MATYHAVPAVGAAIVSLLKAAQRPSEFVNTRFALFRTEDFERGVENGVSIYLYRVANARMSRTQPPQLGPDGGRRRFPLSLSLHYLLTTWSIDAESEQRLLTWTMRLIEDTPVLPSALLNEARAGVFSEREAVELILEDPSLAEVVGIWRSLRHPFRLSASYAARVIAIDPIITGEVTVAGQIKPD